MITDDNIKEIIATNCNTIKAARKHLEDKRAKAQSTWHKGVLTIAIDHILPDATPENAARLNSAPDVRKALLAGADSVKEYVDGGCALIYTSDIVATLCPPSERKRWENLKTDAARERWAGKLWDANQRATWQALFETIDALFYATRRTDYLEIANSMYFEMH